MLINKIPKLRQARGWSVTELYEEIIRRGYSISWSTFHSLARDNAENKPIPDRTWVVTLELLSLALDVGLDDIVEVKK